MSKITVLRKLFQDIQYRAGQHGFDVQTRFDRQQSTIQIQRRSDKVIIFRDVDIIDKNNLKLKITQGDVVNSQTKIYEHFVSYMAFYGVFTVAESYDDEQKEKKKKEEKEKKKKEKKKEIKK